MIRKRHIAYTILGLASLCYVVACSSNESLDGSPVKDIELSFAASTVESMTTRVGAADTYDNALPVNSEIGVYIYDSDNDDISTVQPVAGESKTWVYKVTGAADANGYSPLRLTSHVKNPKFPTTGSGGGYKSNVRIFAIFPNNTAVKPSTASYTFSVNADQTTAANVIASDLLVSDEASYNSTQCESRLSLLLKHRMAKVTVVFTPKSGSDLTAANMPTNFSVLNVYPDVTVTLPKSAANTGAVSNGNGTMTSESSPLQACTSHSFFIPPQTLAAGTTLLKFNINANEATDTYPAFKGINGATFVVPTGGVTFQAGYQYLITVLVDVDFITMPGSIIPWTDGGQLEYPEYTDSIL